MKPALQKTLQIMGVALASLIIGALLTVVYRNFEENKVSEAVRIQAERRAAFEQALLEINDTQAEYDGFYSKGYSDALDLVARAGSAQRIEVYSGEYKAVCAPNGG